MSHNRLVEREGVLQAVFHVGRLAEFMRVGELLFLHLLELVKDEELIEMIEASVRPVEGWQTKVFESVFDFRLYRVLLYVLLRAIKPRVAIETGVLHGLTSIFLLRAMERNGQGRLISIDLPSYPDSGPANRDGYQAVLPAGREPGWIVPSGRFPGWDLRLGSSMEVLPAIAGAVEQIDFFCHDSEHTFATMWFELNWAWERLREGGVLLCDNIEASSAFADFARRVDRPTLTFPAPDTRLHQVPRFALLIR